MKIVQKIAIVAKNITFYFIWVLTLLTLEGCKTCIEVDEYQNTNDLNFDTVIFENPAFDFSDDAMIQTPFASLLRLCVKYDDFKYYVAASDLTIPLRFRPSAWDIVENNKEEESFDLALRNCVKAEIDRFRETGYPSAEISLGCRGSYQLYELSEKQFNRLTQSIYGALLQMATSNIYQHKNVMFIRRTPFFEPSLIFRAKHSIFERQRRIKKCEYAFYDSSHEKILKINVYFPNKFGSANYKEQKLVEEDVLFLGLSLLKNLADIDSIASSLSNKYEIRYRFVTGSQNAEE